MKKLITKSVLLKKVSLFLSVSVFAIAVNAQPVVTSLTPAPNNNKWYIYDITDSFTHTAGGPAQTWDYSNIAYDPSHLYVIDVPYSGLSQETKDTFPDGNYATELYDNGMLSITSVGKITNTYQTNLGLAFAQGYQIRSVPDTLFIFPMNYQDAFGKRTYDAYGTLKTPFGTFDNVVRIKEGKPGQNKYRYLYFQFEPVYRALMEYYADSTNQLITTTVRGFYSLDDSPSSIEQSSNEANFQIYPNPSGGVFQIKSSLNELTNLAIFNILGKKVYSLSNAHLNNVLIDFSHQPRGMYFIDINNGKERIIRKVLIQ